MIRLDAITVTGTAAITAFTVGAVAPGAESHINAANISVGSDLSLAAGATFTVFNTGGGYSTVKRMRAPWTAPNTMPVCQLTNVASSVSAENIIVEEWNDPVRITLAGDASLTVDYDDPGTIIFGTALTAARTVTLPRHNGVAGNNLFRGRTFKVVKLANAGTTHDITILNYAGATVATIPAATASGTKTIRWDRISLIGAGGIGHWTAEPVHI
jgi:hypothetical protein